MHTGFPIQCHRPANWHPAQQDQPTYYHLHIHLIHVQADVGGSQAISKAVSFDSVIEYLTLMAKPEDSMASVNLVYSVGEATELWQRIFEPLKKGETPVI